VVVEAGSYYFVGPDNGLFSYVYDKEPAHQVFAVTAEKYFRHPVSPSFHGRDVFAPVAAELSKGTKPEQFGPRITDEVRLAPLSPVKREVGKLEGRIIHIDRFGNCITNFTRADLPASTQPRLSVNGEVIRNVRKFFADTSGSKDELFAICGSAGFLELSIKGGSAASKLHARRGDAVILG
jgi:S-adenosylmethionine hydrolase